ncbi:MAG: hypothetical protein CBC73_02360 [Flavobacteriales bacterium TMED113]|nr:MAG: hypothetical protein CBC73_02360 [Flavobacteriales bacterium TMED113]
MIIQILVKMSKIYIFLFFTSVLFAQDSSMNRQDRKYCNTYFLAEKYKMLDDYELALKKYMECIKLYPDEPSAYFEVAKILFANSNYEDAITYVNKAAEIEPNNKWHLFLLIQLYSSQFDYESEAKTWENLLEIEPFNIEFYFDCAIAYLEMGDLKKALKTLSNYEKNVGYNEDIFSLKSKIFNEQEDYKKQVKVLEKGIAIFPNSILLLEDLAKYYIQKSEYDLANSIYSKIVKINPNNSTALLASYTILKNKNRTEDSKKILKKVIDSPNINEQKKQEILYEIMVKEEELNFYYNDIPYLFESCISLYPQSSFFYTVLADFYSLDKQYLLARDNYFKALQLEKNSSVIWERYIYMSLLQNNYNQAVIDSDLAIEKFPLQGSFYYYKGLSQFYQEKYRSAVATLNSGLLYIIDDNWLLTVVYETLGNAYHELAELDSSQEYHNMSDESYEKALSYSPNNPYILNNYSYYLSLRGENLQLAKDMIEKCISLSTSPNPSFMDTYAWVLYKLENYTEAEKIIKKCIDFGGNSAIIYEHYGDILMGLGLTNKAILQWEKALEKEPLNNDLKQKIFKSKND